MAWLLDSPPTRPPSASELLAHQAVFRVLAEAWTDSQVNDPRNRHEEGGWIYLDLATGEIAIRRAPAGARSRLSLANPPLLHNHIIVGTFHTHPNPASEGWTTKPSVKTSRQRRTPAYPGWSARRTVIITRGRTLAEAALAEVPVTRFKQLHKETKSWQLPVPKPTLP